LRAPASLSLPQERGSPGHPVPLRWDLPGLQKYIIRRIFQTMIGGLPNVLSESLIPLLREKVYSVLREKMEYRKISASAFRIMMLKMSKRF
jgi:hypothetical protein